MKSVLSDLDKEMVRRLWQHGIDIFTKAENDEIEGAYYDVQFRRNVWRGPGQPTDRAFRNARRRLMRLKRRKSLTLEASLSQAGHVTGGARGRRR